MKNGKGLMIVGFLLLALFAVGQAVFASSSNATKADDGGMMNRVETNGMTGMMQMMDDQNMQNMMKGMNSPEGIEMINSCNKFMDSLGDK